MSQTDHGSPFHVPFPPFPPPCRHSAASASGASEGGWTKSLPRSWKDTKLVTNVKERDVGDEELKRRQEMVSSMSPAELSAIRGFGDFPVPDFKKAFGGGRSRSASKERR